MRQYLARRSGQTGGFGCGFSGCRIFGGLGRCLSCGGIGSADGLGGDATWRGGIAALPNIIS